MELNIPIKLLILAVHGAARTLTLCNWRDGARLVDLFWYLLQLFQWVLKKSEYTGEAPQVRLQNEQHQQGQTLFFCFCCCCCRSCAGFKQRCCQCHLSCYPFTQPRTNKVCSALLPTHPSCWNVKSHHPEKTLHGCQVSLVLVLDSSTWLADNFTIPMGWFVWQ